MFKNFFITLLFIVFITSANAKQIKIVSDRLEIIRAKNISIFSGNVYAMEDNLEIWSEELIMISSEDESEVKEINANGTVKIVTYVKPLFACQQSQPRAAGTARRRGLTLGARGGPASARQA